MSDTRIAVLVGSLRAESTNRKLAEKLAAGAPEGVTLEIVEGLGELPFFNEDLEADPGEAVTQLRKTITEADRVLIVTPEYNATIPGVLKNAIDWLSRPYAAGAIKGKVVSVVGVTPTPYGGKWAHADAARSVGIAGAIVVEDAIVSQPAHEIDVFADAEVQARFAAAVEKLAGFAPAAV
ncbi:NAD(P)H-dependent oxidoreductase [Nocardioides sp. NPDC006273]|uniref:NADPH-dependent FMN reductase n=1 Tax=Nocardioides sp. NPDC006273 TaxID=3155598 RepID=UPI0033B5C822